MLEQEIDHAVELRAAKTLFYVLRNPTRVDYTENDRIKASLQETGLSWSEFRSLLDTEFPQQEREKGYKPDRVAKKLVGRMKSWLLTTEHLEDILTHNTLIVTFADALGHICRSASKQQMRILLDGLREPKYSKPEQVVLLKPHLAYATARDRDRTLEPFSEVMFICLDKVRTGNAGKKDLKALKVFAEAVYAFFYRYAKN